MNSLARTILIVVLVLLLIGSLPVYTNFNTGWGYGPSGGLGTILVVVIILIVLGKI